MLQLGRESSPSQTLCALRFLRNSALKFVKEEDGLDALPEEKIGSRDLAVNATITAFILAALDCAGENWPALNDVLVKWLALCSKALKALISWAIFKPHCGSSRVRNAGNLALMLHLRSPTAASTNSSYDDSHKMKMQVTQYYDSKFFPRWKRFH
jgi:hypothetical protein